MERVNKFRNYARGFTIETLKLFLLVVLSLVHLWATFDGMSEIIPDMGINKDDWRSYLTPKAFTVMTVVAALTGMLIFALKTMFSEGVSTLTRVFWVASYLFLEVVSIGLGFGFYWKTMNSKDSTATNVIAAQEVVSSAFRGVSTKIEDARKAIQAAADYSRTTAEREAKSGGTCMPATKSGGGQGPIFNLRTTDAANMDQWNTQVKSRLDGLRDEITTLNNRATGIGRQIQSGDVAKATGEITRLNLNIATLTSEVNAFSQSPAIKQIANDMKARAESRDFGSTSAGPPSSAKGAKGAAKAKTAGGGTFLCPDRELSSLLSAASAALLDLPTIRAAPEVPATLGAEATRTAFARLTAWAWRGVTTADFSVAENSGLDLKTNQFRSSGTLTRSDLMALLIAIGIDMGLLMLAAHKKPHDRERDKLVEFFKNYYEDTEGNNAGNARLAWHLIDRVHLRIFLSHYIAIPDTEKEVELSQLAKFFDVLHGKGEVSRALLMSTKRIKRVYADRDSDLAKYNRFTVFRMPNAAFAELLKSAAKKVADGGSFMEPRPMGPQLPMLADHSAPHSGWALEDARDAMHDRFTADEHDKRAPSRRDTGNGADTTVRNGANGGRTTIRPNGPPPLPTARPAYDGEATQYGGGSDEPQTVPPATNEPAATTVVGVSMPVGSRKKMN